MLARRHLLLLATVLFALSGSAAPGQLATFPTAELSIVSASGPHRFTVELATTPGQMEQGLMFRQSLAADAGMLFDYRAPAMAAMCMLFVDERGRIISIHERAVPGSLDPIAAAAPARAVVELNGGTAARLGIRPGDPVLFPIFGNAS
jgi:uncharacterized protein